MTSSEPLIPDHLETFPLNRLVSSSNIVSAWFGDPEEIKEHWRVRTSVIESLEILNILFLRTVLRHYVDSPFQ